MDTEISYSRPSEKEFDRRLRSLRRVMFNKKLDCVVVYGGYQEMYQQNARYFSGYTDLLHFYVVIPISGSPVLLTHSSPMLENARRVSVIEETRWGGIDIAESVVTCIHDMGASRGSIGIVGIESMRRISIPAEHWCTLQRKLPEATLTVVTEIVEEIRAVKSDEEISFLYQGAVATDKALSTLIAAARPGCREYELSAAIRCSAYSAGFAPSFVYVASGPMSMSDSTVTFPAFAQSKREIRKGDVILVETAVGYGGYSGSVGRTICLGKPTPIIQDLHDIALAAYGRLVSILRPGATHDDMLEATSVIVDAGLVVQSPVIKGWDNKIELPWVGLRDSSVNETAHCVFRDKQVVVLTLNACTPDLSTGVFFANAHILTGKSSVCLQKHSPRLIELDC